MNTNFKNISYKLRLVKKFSFFFAFSAALFFPFLGVSQCPTSAFSFSDSEVCIGQPLEIVNASADANNYLWDFCVGDLSLAPSAFLQINNIREPFEVEIVKSGGQYYGFVSSRRDRTVYRIDFGTRLDETNPTIVDLGVEESGLLSIELVQEGSSWYGFVQSIDNKLFRLEFGSDILSMPTKIDLGIITGFSSAVDLEIVESMGEKIGFVANLSGNTLVRLNFNGSYLNSPIPQTITVAGASSLGGLSLIEDCNIWYLYVSSRNTNEIFELEFGAELLALPTSINNLGVSVPSGRGISVVNEFGDYYLFAQSGDGDVYRISLGADLGVTTPTIDNLGNFGLLGTQFGFSVYYDSSQWYGFSSVNTTAGNIYHIAFQNDCDVNELVSHDFEPSNIVYSASGTYKIGLRAKNAENKIEASQASILVNTSVVPSVAFDLDNNRCVINDNSFTAGSGFSSYSWDFDGDGLEDSNQQNPTFNYSSIGAGTYNVRLDISDGTCDNFLEKEIIMYDAPPVPTFTITSGSSFCTNSELIFSNTTDETGYGDELSYQWVIDGIEVNSENTTYTFISSGIKTIALQSFVPGCSSAVSEQEVSVGEGPVVDFSYLNNCFGSPIQFLSEVEGLGITSYTWDFGDGFGTSIEKDTVYQYSEGGTYEVTLTVTNEEGCQTVHSEDLFVNDQSLVDFSTVGSVENLPISFFSEDLTSPLDSIVSWEWNFANLNSSTEPNPNFSFAVGSYDVTLTIGTAQGCQDQVTKSVIIEKASCPTSLFSMIDRNVCLGEPFILTNSTVNGFSYQWDFCVGELSSAPSAFIQIDDVSEPFELEIVKSNGRYHGFVSSRGDRTVYRVDFGTSLDESNPAIVDLEVDKPGLLSVEMVQEGSNWYGFVQSIDNKLFRLEFGNDILSMPTTIDLGIITGFNSSVDLEIVESMEEKIGFVANLVGDSLVRLNFEGSYLNSPVPQTIVIPGASSLGGLSLIEDCDSWYMYVSSRNTNEIYELGFGMDLLAAPAIINSLGVSVPSGSGVSVVNELGDYYLFAQSGGGDVYRVDLGATLGAINPNIENLGNFGLLSTQFGFSVYYDSSRWYGFSSVNTTEGNICQITFPDDCSASIAESSAFEPSGISYNTSGRKYIQLTAYDENNHVSYYLDSVDVSSDVAPAISLIVDESRCLTNTNTFTPSTPGLTSYSWDFNNDGIEDSNLESPNFQFPAAGTYTVRVDVSDGSCTNFYVEEITIYDPPPAPSFSFIAPVLCADVSIDFSNLTSDSEYTGPLLYTWEFIDDTSGSTEGTSNEKSPSFAFLSPGTKTVRLTSSIPGCEEVTEQTITINTGPTADFVAPTVCQTDAMAFTNTSSDGVSFFWNFGDGVTSTNENPSHIFQAAGNYNVALTATNAQGCDDTTVIEVAVSDLPVVSFDFGVPCTSADGTVFTDLSTVDNSEIIGWSWRVDGSEVSTEQNPTLSFTEASTRNVELLVTSANGCSSTYSETIEVLPTPAPDFSGTIGCQGELSSFEDATSSVGNQIVSWLWDVEGTIYTTQDIEHVFDSPGFYDISLEVTGQNFCTETVTQTVEVLQLPTVDFVVIGDCDNVLLAIQDQSTAFNDAVRARRWTLDGASVGNGPELFLENLPSGTYEVMLEVETEAGCQVSSTQSVEINASPTSDFTFARSYGLPGDELVFSNASIGAVSYQWLLEGGPLSTSATNQAVLFSEPGTYDVSLVATNSLGCSDTTTQEVLIAVPEVDLRIGSFDLVDEGGVGKILMEVQNFSNLPIEVTEAKIELQNQFAVTEQIAEFIGIGETRLVSLNVGIPLALTQPSYFCVTLASQYAALGYEDIDPINNEKCITLEPKVSLEDLYPNPVTDRFTLKLVMPVSGDATISLLNAAGRLQSQIIYATSVGLNTLTVDVSTLDSGIYFVTIELPGQTFKQKVIKL